MCENVNEEFRIKSRRPLKGILISVACSIYLKTGRDTKCYIWLLVVLGLGEQVRECHPFTSPAVLVYTASEAGTQLKEPTVGKGC